MRTAGPIFVFKSDIQTRRFWLQVDTKKMFLYTTVSQLQTSEPISFLRHPVLEEAIKKSSARVDEVGAMVDAIQPAFDELWSIQTDQILAVIFVQATRIVFHV